MQNVGAEAVSGGERVQNSSKDNRDTPPLGAAFDSAGMNKYFGELPTALPRTPQVENLHLKKIALLFATGETRAAQLEVMPIPDSPKVAMSAKLTWLGDNPRDGLIQYLTKEGVDRIHPDDRANSVGATLALDLVG